VDDFRGKFDSLYRLVIVAAKRANQIGSHEHSHGFGAAARGHKPTIKALDEVIGGKLTFTTEQEDAGMYASGEEGAEE
jgi:DNA-directed RNA polymerase omega subunit